MIQSGKYDEDEFYYLDTEKTLGVVVELGNNGKIRAPSAASRPEQDPPQRVRGRSRGARSVGRGGQFTVRKHEVAPRVGALG